jgi:riboflavin biosynthesis pyrimidine reductase
VDLQRCFNASEDIFSLPRTVKDFYGPFGFPAPADDRRPYMSSNFVIGLDGRASFRELQGRTSGSEVSRSKEDRWLMDFLRAHHDGQLIGANTLHEESLPAGPEWDYGIDDQQLQTYRTETLGLKKQKIIVVTSSGNINISLRVFSSPRVEPWILTGEEGEEKLRLQLKTMRPEKKIKIVCLAGGPRIDLSTATQLLRQEHGIRTLLCEGGPTLYGELLNERLIDEDFRTISLQVLGESTNRQIERPTSYGSVSYTPETAPWFRLISIHYALPHHAFFRLRYVGPRTLQD